MDDKFTDLSTISRVLADSSNTSNSEISKPKPDKAMLINDPYNIGRWDIYKEDIKNTLSQNRSVIFLSPELKLALSISERIRNELKLGPINLSRSQPQRQELINWLNIKYAKEKSIVVGTRSAIFAPVRNLGLIIIDEESNPNYKQQQHPFYHTREVAFMRAAISKAKIILASQAPSIECWYLVRKKRLKLIDIKKDFYPRISIVDMKEQFSIRRKRYPLISLALESRLRDLISQKKKIIVFYNRRGFGRVMRCNSCGYRLICPRCEVEFIYHYDAKILYCPYCNYKQNLAKLCPQCRKDYIRFKTPGIEKLESELYRLFPGIKIKILDQDIPLDNFDILITTQKILGYDVNFKFDIVAIISADTLWNRTDFRAQEIGFDIILRLVGLSNNEVFIQTFYPENISLKAIKDNNPSLFYESELKDRKRLNFPPFSHLINIHLRSSTQQRVKDFSERLFDKLKQYKIKGIEPISCAQAHPKKLRDKFRFQIILKTKVIDEKFNTTLRQIIKKISHPGVIIGVDVNS